MTADEARLFSRLGYEDLGYETESEFEAYLNELVPLTGGIVDQFCHVPKGFFEDSGLAVLNQLLDYRADWIHLKYHPVLSVSKVEVNVSAYGTAASWSELSVSTEYVVAKDRGLIKVVGDTIPAKLLQSVRVSYTAGYSSTPEAVRYVVLNIVSNIAHAMLQQRISPVVRVDDFVVRMIMPEAFTRDLQAVLATYVHQQVFVG